MKTVNVFFYGTLMGENDSTFVRRDSVDGIDLYHLGGFPGAVDGQGTVHGEVHNVSLNELYNLYDMIEGYDRHNHTSENNLYRRETRAVSTGEAVEMYIFNQDVGGRRLIESGDWREGK